MQIAPKKWHYLQRKLMPCNPSNIPPTTSTQLWSGLFQHSPLQLQFEAFVCFHTCISDGDGELDCHYLSPSPPQLFFVFHPFFFFLAHTCRQSPLSAALPPSTLPGLRWQSFKDHTSRTHIVFHEYMSIHTWKGDYMSPPRQLQITINGNANH